jgi:hypothetical protein
VIIYVLGIKGRKECATTGAVSNRTPSRNNLASNRSNDYLSAEAVEIRLLGHGVPFRRSWSTLRSAPAGVYFLAGGIMHLAVLLLP